MKMPMCAVMSCLLLLWLTCTYVHAECPGVCSCSESYRTVDCSWRGVRHLPEGLQRNIQSLNLTHNRLSDLDHHLSSFTHLRILDISYNRLLHFPASLPRALWEINVSGNRLRVLNKDDTAYQWNLRVLDLSVNKLERVVFINNTLPNLKALNLSHNKFWTVPTNMPPKPEVVIYPTTLWSRSCRGPWTSYTGWLGSTCMQTASPRSGKGHSSICKSEAHHSRGHPWACEETANISHLLVWPNTLPSECWLPLPHLAHLRRGWPVQDRELALLHLHAVPICLWNWGAKYSICTSSHHTLLVGDVTPKHQGWPDRI